MPHSPLDLATIRGLFTHCDGQFQFARWGRPIAPVVFGVDDTSLIALKEAIAQTVAIAGHHLSDTDPELGANFIWIFCADWAEVATLPDIDKLLPNWPQTEANLQKNQANTYRYMRYDGDGGIKFCALVIRIAGAYGQQSVPVIGVTQTAQSLCRFAPDCFAKASPFTIRADGASCVIKAEYRAMLRAAYDPRLPVTSTDGDAMALRLKARADIILAQM